MKSEPLNIRDKTFLINRTIQQAPTGTLVREFFKNAEESAALAPVDNRRIRIYPVDVEGVRKLAFWNTGLGMSAEELRQATDLSSSINKELALDGNFGIGAKVSGLAVSREGIRYRSCKGGRVHQVTIGYDEELQTYARFAEELPDHTQETIFDVTETVKKDRQDVSFDWTEVVLHGESADHDTVAEPLGKGKEEDRSYIPTAIFRRFADLADGVEVRIDVAMTKGGGKEETGRFRQLKLLRDVLNQLPNNQLVRDDNSGIAVRYVHDPKAENSAHTLSSRANAATASTTFCALVHKGERYDFKTKKAWGGAAPNFGIPFGSKVLSVEILIPPEMAMPNQYRDQLTWPEDRSTMTADDFSAYVRELMPEWVKEVIRQESPEASENLDDLQKDLQKLLDEFRVPTVTQKFSRKPEAERSDTTETGVDLSSPAHFSGVETSDGEAGSGDGEAPKEGRGRRAQSKKVRRAPEGAQASLSSKALERVPEVKILTDPEQIADKLLKGRAGRFYKDGQQLFVNGLYPVVDRMAAELEREFAGSADPEEIRVAAVQASRKSMAFRVGKVVCFALSKRLAEDWSVDNLDTATSPESLSMAADDYRQSIGIGKKWVKESLKVNQVEGVAAA
jgi:hypothetical protein